MDEIIAELRERAQHVPVPLELPDDDDLLAVEESILLQLPKEYRFFLASVSDLVLGTMEPATASDPVSHTYLPELAATCWDQGLPRHLIPICLTEDKIYTLDPDGLVELWQRGEPQEQNWETVWDWAIQVWLPTA